MENRIAALEERLRIPTFSPSKREALERLSQPTPPPRVRVVPESPRVPGPAVEPQETAKTRDDIEFKLGANLLLRGGAVVVVIGICYLVALAVQRGVITPAVQFVGELVLCLGFIGFGWWKRAQKVEFGHLMIGVGSAGMFASFGAGYAVKHLYDGSTAILAFTALSLANLAFADLRSTRSFLALGMIGGLVAAMLPVRDHHPHVGTAIHFLILIPALAVAVRRRWLDMASLTTTGAAISLWVLFDARDSLSLCQGAVAASSLLCAFAIHMLTGDAKPEFAKFQSIVPLLLGGLATGRIDNGVGIELAVGGISLAMTILPVAGRTRWAIGSITYLALIPPVALAPISASAYWIASAIAVSVGTWALRSADVTQPRSAAVIVSSLATACAGLAYVHPWAPFDYTLATETGLLCGMIAAIAVTTVATIHWVKDPQPIVLIAIFVASFPFGRIGVVHLVPTAYVSIGSDSLRLAYALTWPLLIAAPLVAWLAKARSWREVDALAWTILVFVGAITIYTFADGPRQLVISLPPVLSILFATAIVARFSISGREVKGGMVAFAAFYGALFVGRLAYLLVEHWFVPNDSSLAFRWAAVVVAVCSIVGSKLTRDRNILSASWVAMILATVSGLSMESGSAVAALACIVVATVCTVGLSISAAQDKTLTSIGGSILLWVQTTLLGGAILTHFAHVRATPAMSISWTIFASALMFAGFRFADRSLRLMSFTVFGATLIKVFAFDLTDLDPGVRVAVLLLLGLAMLFAGYRFLVKKPTN